MRRLAVVAVLLCLSAWAADRVGARPSHGIVSAGTVSCLATAPDDTGSPDDWWVAGHRSSASLTESGWKSRFHHSELAGISCPGGFDALRRDDVLNNRPTPHPAPHLRHIPLLI